MDVLLPYGRRASFDRTSNNNDRGEQVWAALCSDTRQNHVRLSTATTGDYGAALELSIQPYSSSDGQTTDKRTNRMMSPDRMGCGRFPPCSTRAKWRLGVIGSATSHNSRSIEPVPSSANRDLQNCGTPARRIAGLRQTVPSNHRYLIGCLGVRRAQSHCFCLLLSL